MVGLVAARITQMVPVALLVTIFVFLLLHLAPGDPVRLLVGPTATEADVDRLRERLGLDAPLPVQYGKWLAGVVHGDLGRSIRSGAPVADVIPARLWNTLRLTLASMAIAVILGIGGGAWAASRPGSLRDMLTMAIAVAGLSIPAFWLGLMLILFFAVRLQWLPAGGGDSWRYIVLPALSLGLASAALIARMVRSSLLEVMGSDYVRCARAKGVSDPKVLLGHALPNALIPAITVIGLQFGTLMAGAVVTEVVFAWPGIGQLLVSSIADRDFPVVQASLLVVSISFLVVNLITDLLYAAADPRVRLA